MKKKMKQLVAASIKKDNVLDEERVEAIANRLTRHELKEYIRALKNYEKRKQLIIDCSFTPTKEQEEMLKKQFPGKELVVKTNPDLMFGITITDNDIVYDMNLRRTLDKIEEYIEQQYD